MPNRIQRYPAFWLEADRSFGNLQKQAFNEWREELVAVLEAIDKDTRSLAVQAEDTPLAEQSRELAKRIKHARKRITGSVPVLQRNYGW